VKQLWVILGQLTFWLSWPVLLLYLRGSRRTRISLVCDTRILVVKVWLGNGKWMLPGGGLHKNEVPLAGALRELKEETGIELKPSRLSFVEERHFSSTGLRFKALFFTAKAPELYRLNPQRLEISSASWVKRSELNKSNASADVLTALEVC
jgi:8-oxo-dGTP pyrophosphatase MutT (NUDIX family)